MKKIIAGFGYSNTRHEIEDFDGSSYKPLIIDIFGRRWRGQVTVDGDEILININGRFVSIPRSDIVTVGSPLSP